MKIRSKIFRFIVISVSGCFMTTQTLPSVGFAQVTDISGSMSLNLPIPGTMVSPSAGFVPPMLRGLKIHPENPLRFDFIVDTGDSKVEGDELKKESEKLIKYFMASLTVPEDDLWVNLSPYEKDRIIPEKFGQTEMGRDLLAQDYLLKQLTASLIYPEEGLGKNFWDRVFKKAYELYGTTNIPINTFNKVWIIPDKAVVYENKDTAFIMESHLKVMLEGDYLALSQNLNKKEFGTDKLPETDVKQISDVSSQIVKEVILPEIEKEVNEGENFSLLRQVYQSLILATWYKEVLKESVLNKVYANKNKIKGVDVEDKDIRQKIYEHYLRAYQKGVYDYVKEENDKYLNAQVARRYVSGGVLFSNLKDPKTLIRINSADDAAVENTIHGRDFVIASSLKRMYTVREHRDYEMELGIADILEATANELNQGEIKVQKKRKKVPTWDGKFEEIEYWDFEEYVRAHDGEVKHSHGRMYFDQRDILRFIDKRIGAKDPKHKKGHAGRGKYQRAIYAPDEFVGEHEAYELEAKENYFLEKRIVTQVDIENGLLGAKVQQWANDQVVDIHERGRRQGELIDMDYRIEHEAMRVQAEAVRRAFALADTDEKKKQLIIHAIEAVSYDRSDLIEEYGKGKISEVLLPLVKILKPIFSKTIDEEMDLYHMVFDKRDQKGKENKTPYQVAGDIVRDKQNDGGLGFPWDALYPYHIGGKGVWTVTSSEGLEDKFLPILKIKFQGKVLRFSYKEADPDHLRSLITDFIIKNLPGFPTTMIARQKEDRFIHYVSDLLAFMCGVDAITTAAQEVVIKYPWAIQEISILSPSDNPRIQRHETVQQNQANDVFDITIARNGNEEKTVSEQTLEEQETKGNLTTQSEIQAKRIVEMAKQRFPGLMAAKPKDIVLIDDPKLDSMFREYLQREIIDEKNFWEAYPNLCRIFFEDTLEMRLIKAYLVNNPHMRFIILERLPPPAYGNINPLSDFEESRAFGGEKFLDQHTSFSIGLKPESWAAAEEKAKAYFENRSKFTEEELIGKELKLIVGIADRRGEIPQSKIKFDVTHNRRIFIPLPDGRLVTIKSIGQLGKKHLAPFFYRESTFWGALREKGIANMISLSFSEWEKGEYPQQLGWRVLHNLPDGYGELKSSYELSGEEDTIVQTYEISLGADRFNDLPGIAQDISAINRLAWQVSYSLSHFYNQEIILSPREMMERRLKRLGRTLARQVNNGQTQETLHEQDPSFADELSDVNELFDFRKEGKEHGIEIIKYIRENFENGYHIIKSIWGKSGRYRSKLLPGLFETFELFASGYVDALNEELLNIWAQELNKENNYIYSLIVSEEIIDSVTNEWITRNLKYKMYEKFVELIKNKLTEKTQQKKSGVIADSRYQDNGKALPSAQSDGLDVEGGIDFTPQNLNLQTQGEGIQIPQLNIDPAELEHMDIEGFSPIIYGITPVTNLPLLIGVADDCQEDDPSDHSPDKKKRKCPENVPIPPTATKKSDTKWL